MPNGKDYLLRRIEQEWGRLQRLLEKVPQDRLEEPGAVGEWSVKDVMGHITSWEDYLIGEVQRILRGEPAPQVSMEMVHRWNAEWSAQKRPWPLEQVRREMEETHRRLVEFLASLPEEALSEGSEAYRRVRADSYNHYAEHARDIRRWLRQGASA